MSKNAADPPLTFRAPTKNREQLKQLKKLWGDTTQSRVITRCIEWAWFVEIGNTKIDKKPSQLIEEEEGKKKS